MRPNTVLDFICSDFARLWEAGREQKIKMKTYVSKGFKPTPDDIRSLIQRHWDTLNEICLIVLITFTVSLHTISIQLWQYMIESNRLWFDCSCKIWVQ